MDDVEAEMTLGAEVRGGLRRSVAGAGRRWLLTVTIMIGVGTAALVLRLGTKKTTDWTLRCFGMVLVAQLTEGNKLW